jgi:isopenicillin N synthase-like dioxygenase
MKARPVGGVTLDEQCDMQKTLSQTREGAGMFFELVSSEKQQHQRCKGRKQRTLPHHGENRKGFASVRSWLLLNRE